MSRNAKSRVFLPITMVILLLAGGSSWADDFAPVYHPQMEISRLDGTISIDGRLEDGG